MHFSLHYAHIIIKSPLSRLLTLYNYRIIKWNELVECCYRELFMILVFEIKYLPRKILRGGYLFRIRHRFALGTGKRYCYTSSRNNDSDTTFHQLERSS